MNIVDELKKKPILYMIYKKQIKKSIANNKFALA